MKNYFLAKSSSLSSAVLLFLAGISSVLAMTLPSLIFGFLIVPAYITMIACIHHVSENKLYGLLATIFASMYGVFVSFNYFLQIIFMERGMQMPQLLDITNSDSIFLIIELLGYFFMGVSTLCIVPLLSSTRLEIVIKILFLINFILGVGGVVGYALNFNMVIMIIGLMVWNVIMPTAALFLFFYFQNLYVEKNDKTLHTTTNKRY
jgi:hypothetical protein